MFEHNLMYDDPGLRFRQILQLILQDQIRCKILYDRMYDSSPWVGATNNMPSETYFSNFLER